MLTARGEELDRVMGFEVGVDDYVVKPFSARELLLRIRAVLRRNGAESLAEVRPITVFGSLRIDREAHRVWVGEVEVELTAMELRLLDALFQRRGRVQSRDQLVESVWGDVGMVTERAVDTQVKRLRSKLGEAGDYIETLRGVGYRFAERPERLS
jgi:two-component system phosphate regulon response regulator PhoB